MGWPAHLSFCAAEPRLAGVAKLTADEGPMDQVLVAALYAEHADELRRFLTGVLRDGQLAADVVQTAFARLLEQGHATQAGSRKAWLFRVAYNEALAIRRRQGVGDKVARLVAWTAPAGSHAADEPAVRKEAVAAVRQALQTLPAEQQQVVRMRIYEEKTFAVIAAELNIPLGTALARMHAALAKLRQKLTDV